MKINRIAASLFILITILITVIFRWQIIKDDCHRYDVLMESQGDSILSCPYHEQEAADSLAQKVLLGDTCALRQLQFFDLDPLWEGEFLCYYILMCNRYKYAYANRLVAMDIYNMYMNAGLQIDEESADLIVDLLEDGTRRGEPWCMSWMGDLLLEGELIRQDSIKGNEYLRISDQAKKKQFENEKDM